ncbi:MAG: ATP-binding protein [Gammaproteobacteria bacterium]|nr:ATP-binding protein [Gammaproteobacteria bacterium]
MDRKITKNLCDWYKAKDRKPIILRGARQVGKTWLVRNLATKLNLDLLELNFERNIKLKTIFKDNDPQKTLLRLESFFNKNINVGQSLLFLDEIQSAPELLSKLRWFAEEKPELAIIATGSLLDFALEEYKFSMPVGRISYMYLEPVSFEEFLLAQNQHKLCELLASFELKDEIPEVIHERLWQLLRDYVFVGGMPSAINNWIEKKSFISVGEIQQNILQAFRDDFSKYAKRISTERLDEVFRAVPNLLGKKFKYSSVNRDVRFESLKNALNLLCKARICHKVFFSNANGIPLDAGIKENIFKVIFLDTGLASAALGLSFNETYSFDEFKLSNEGRIAEQLIGQLLRTISPYYIDSKLHYWINEKTGAESEIDYLIQQNTEIIPIEVKSGTTGTLRSLHQFMEIKNLKIALRLNADYPSITDVKVKNHAGKLIEYKLISLPLYLIEQINRILTI